MKNFTLLVAGLLLTGSLASASEANVSSVAAYHTPIDYRNAEPVIFMERGIEFMVFPNGEMDFNTQPASSGSYYYKNANVAGRRNDTYGAAYANGGVRVEHDYNGRVRRVGNVYINYDYNGRVKRIGSVYMSYNRYALAQIGMLTLFYDRYGRIVDARGFVNNASRNYYYDACGDGGNNYDGDNYNGYDNDGYYNNGGSGSYYNNNGGNNDNTYYRKAKETDKRDEKPAQSQNK
ncbi:MAG: hypothetical protein ACOVRN_14980 [Flavobacterium sp.]